MPYSYSIHIYVFPISPEHCRWSTLQSGTSDPFLSVACLEVPKYASDMYNTEYGKCQDQILVVKLSACNPIGN